MEVAPDLASEVVPHLGLTSDGVEEVCQGAVITSAQECQHQDSTSRGLSFRVCHPLPPTLLTLPR